MVYTLTYCGGIPEIAKTGEQVCSIMPDYFNIQVGMLKTVKIPYVDIINVTLQTNEQISKDVTLTRLLLVGVLAFGAKKTTRDVAGSLVIDCKIGGIKTSAIFTGKDAPRAYNDIVAKRAELGLSNQSGEPTAPVADNAAEIQKFHELMKNGIISEDEFNAKKAQLLGL